MQRGKLRAGRAPCRKSNG